LSSTSRSSSLSRRGGAGKRECIASYHPARVSMWGSHSARSEDDLGCKLWFSNVRRNWSAAALVGTTTAQWRARDTSA
jgi:hypothetical protein